MEVEYELKKATLALLKADAGVSAIATGGVHDKLMPAAKPPDGPHVVMGAWTTTSDDYECIDMYLVQISIDVYSSGTGEDGTSATVSRLASRVRAAMKNMPDDVIADAQTTILHVATRILSDVGGTVQRSNITLTATFD